MPAPSTAAELLELVRKSGLVDDARLADCPTDDRPALELAERLVADGVLTEFQTEQLLRGKWKRFLLGGYKVLERLGAGGMGCVLLAEHRHLCRRVALKVLPTERADNPTAVRRFYREARALAALDHPNIVRAFDLGRDGKVHFLVMEYVEGRTLHEVVWEDGPLPCDRAADYVRQAAAGLQYAYEAAGVVHRDIKPGNLLVDPQGLVKVLDLGLAHFFDDDEFPRRPDRPVRGTPDFLAPEQVQARIQTDIRSDVYSLGATFYYLLTRKTLIPAGSRSQKRAWLRKNHVPPMATLLPQAPPRVVAVLDKMLARDPDDRYQTPGEVVEALAG